MIFYVVLISCFVLFCVYLSLEKRTKVPPGSKEIPIERGWPILGIVNEAKASLCNYLYRLSEKHGPIYRIKLGMREIVVLNSFEYIRAALMENGDALSGRWKSIKFIMAADDAGISLLDGPVWAEQRRFVMKTLRDFGLGKKKAVDIVQGECIHFLDDLEMLHGKGVDFDEFIPRYTGNIIAKFIMNKRLSGEDPTLHAIEDIVNKVSKQMDPLFMFLIMFPFIEKNEWLIRFVIWITSRRSLFDRCHQIFHREIEEHLKNLDVNSEGEDLIDRFLIKQQQLKETGAQIGTYTNWQMIRNALELFVAGYDTTSTTLVWACMLMAMYPESQIKVHGEIVDKIGNERLPTMGDRVSLNYTQAVIDEIMRVSSVVPLSVLHRTLNDVIVKGYFIPKDTEIIPNLFACHFDPKVWEKPFEFYPEHFLSTNENGHIKYTPRDESIPFSMGKRQCLGESLGRMELFIFFTSIFQRFQVNFAKGTHVKAHFDIFHSNNGIMRVADFKDFVFTRKY